MIIFFNPQSSANRKPILPMSLLAVGAVLEGQYAYEIVDGNLVDDPLAELHGRIQQAGPTPILAVTVMPGPQLQQAVPGQPVSVLGLNGTPEAGDILNVVENEAKARDVSEYRARKKREKAAARSREHIHTAAIHASAA